MSNATSLLTTAIELMRIVRDKEGKFLRLPLFTSWFRGIYLQLAQRERPSWPALAGAFLINSTILLSLDYWSTTRPELLPPPNTIEIVLVPLPPSLVELPSRTLQQAPPTKGEPTALSVQAKRRQPTLNLREDEEFPAIAVLPLGLRAALWHRLCHKLNFSIDMKPDIDCPVASAWQRSPDDDALPRQFSMEDDAGLLLGSRYAGQRLGDVASALGWVGSSGKSIVDPYSQDASYRDNASEILGPLPLPNEKQFSRFKSK